MMIIKPAQDWYITPLPYVHIQQATTLVNIIISFLLNAYADASTSEIPKTTLPFILLVTH